MKIPPSLFPLFGSVLIAGTLVSCDGNDGGDHEDNELVVTATASRAASPPTADPNAPTRPITAPAPTISPNTADATVPPRPDSVALEQAFGGLPGARPVELLPFEGCMLLADQAGTVTFLAEGRDPELVLDLTHVVLTEGNEEGLLSIQLDPAGPYLWAYYSVAGPRRTLLARFGRRGEAWDATPLVVLAIAQPYPNHNGGAIRFGPDGMLYLGVGDGGSAGDPHGHGQDATTLLGSILRLDVRESSPGAPYAIPADNPFTNGPVGGVEGHPLVWAYGLRNPWRMAFDPATGTLWAGDVGQDAIEEINRIEAGGNYGWNRIEGSDCYDGRNCFPDGTILPWAEYGHAEGCSVTGGVVYRGYALPELVGQYLYADFCSGRLWAVPVADDPVAGVAPVLLLETGHQVASFAMGPDFEVYLLTFDAGILRLTAR